MEGIGIGPSLHLRRSQQHCGTKKSAMDTKDSEE